MNLTLITPAVDSLLTMSQMRMHARTFAAGASDETPTIEDSMVSLYGATAQEYVETVTNRALLASTWEMHLDDWPCGAVIHLPKGKLSASGLLVNYTPEGGTEQVFAASNYIIDTGGDKGSGRIVLRNNKLWPSDTLDAVNGIRIRFTAGWASPANVPKQITQAALLLFSHWYDNREAVTVGNTASVVSKEMEYSIKVLLRNWMLQPLWNQHD